MFIFCTQKCFHRIPTSVVNTLVGGCRHVSKSRRKDYLYGLSSCYGAIMADKRKISKLYLSKNLEEEELPRDHLLRKTIEAAQTRNISISYKPTDVLDILLLPNRDFHEGVVLEAGKLDYRTLERDLTPGKHDRMWLALDRIQDPMNLGAIFRSCAYFGVNRVIVGEKYSCPLSALASKASSGALEWVPAYSVNCMKTFLTQATASGWDTIGTVGVANNNLSRSVDSVDDISVNKPTILVVGSEGYGLDDGIVKSCSQMVTLSSFGSKLPRGLDSLNVSVATGVMLHYLL